VRVAAAFHTTPPTVPSDTREDWSEIVEASLHAPRGRLFVESLDHGPVPDLPLLSDAGPGWYRLRVCARGRDTAYDAVVAAPVEDYRIDIWPAAPSPNAVIRSTDRCGQGLRASAADRRVPPSPGPDTQTQIDAEERAATIRRQTLLQAAGGQAQNAPADSRLRRPEPGQPTPPLRNDQPGPS
ncbi:hypothetical protein, partial [Kitasatospora sp. NPDC007106]|uniref:hypothetical protein n=1 Tax=Kitasatospora sp. NPDC007106 TaxID=3156914 RepID=UPI0033D3CC4A